MSGKQIIWKLKNLYVGIVIVLVCVVDFSVEKKKVIKDKVRLFFKYKFFSWLL